MTSGTELPNNGSGPTQQRRMRGDPTPADDSPPLPAFSEAETLGQAEEESQTEHKPQGHDSVQPEQAQMMLMLLEQQHKQSQVMARQDVDEQRMRAWRDARAWPGKKNSGRQVAMRQH